jgi:hypothetical protein
MSELDIPTADPDDIRAEADRILDLPELRDDRNLIERAIDWIGDRLGELIPDGAGGGGSGVVLTLVIIAIGVVVLTLGFRALNRLHRERKARAPDRAGLTVILGEAIEPGQLDSAIMAAESAGDWKSSLLARYRRMIATLVGGGVLSENPGRTTGEYRLEMGDARPEHTGDFTAATTAFEQAYYGDSPVGSEDVAALRSQIAAVMTEPVNRS